MLKKKVQESDIGDELDALIKEAKKKHEGDYAEVERANRRIAAVKEALGKVRFNKRNIDIKWEKDDVLNKDSWIRYDCDNKEIYVCSPYNYRGYTNTSFTEVAEMKSEHRLFVSSKLEELMKEAIKHIK